MIRLGLRRDERGVAAVEFALLLPVVVFLAIAGATLVRLFVDHGDVTQLSSSAARYATRHGLDPDRPGVYRFRPTAAEVEAYVRRIATVPVDSVTVSPDPSTALPNTLITVTITTHSDAGPLGAVANGLAGVLGQSAPFPEGAIDRTTSTAMREE